MKKSFFLLTVMVLLSISSCKKGTVDRMMVVRDCTGTYLRVNSKDYQVCNEERLRGFSDGAMVVASFKDIRTCQEAESRITCKMLHCNEGWVEVLSVH